MQHELSFNIYDTKVLFQCNDRLLHEKIKKDFWFFLKNDLDKYDMKIKSMLLDDIPWDLIPNIYPSKQSKNSITYDKGRKRYNDYYGKLLSIYNYQTNEGRLYTEDREKLHEISYLLILSRSGKRMDSIGLHKLHAFGVIYNKKAILGMMPSKGGKTTHLLEFLKNHSCDLISDDTPVITRSGKIYPFALRIGMEKTAKSLNIDPKYLYSIKREYFGEKKLLSLEGVSAKVSHDYDQVILFLGKRHNSRECHINKISKVGILFHLFIHMIIGLGLPMVLEYFWENGFRDFFLKMKIFFSRCLAAFSLALRAKTYIIYLGKDIEHNVESIKNLG